MSDLLRLKTLKVGETTTRGILSKRSDTGAAKTPSSATVCLYDLVPVSGTVVTGGVGTIADTARTEAVDYFNGLPLEVTDATDDRTELTEITDFGTGVLHFGALSFSPAAGDAYRILGTPVLPETAATTSGTGIDFAVTPADATKRPRLLRGRALLTYSATDIEACPLEVDVILSSGKR